MKKCNRLAATLAILTWVFISAVPSVGTPVDWESAIALADSPKQVARLVRRNVEYRSEDRDRWSSGRETWERGYGDCEDLAAAVVELCAAIGAEAKVMGVYPEGLPEGHAVAIGHWKGKTWMASNGYFSYVDDLDDAKRDLAREFGWPRDAVRIEPLRDRATARK